MTRDSEQTWRDFDLHLLLPMFVYESVEGHAIFPAGREVRDVDVGVTTTQQCQSNGKNLFCQRHFVNLNVII